MDSESAIFEEALEESLKTDVDNATLIASGRWFCYWRLEHEGRYFFFKTNSTDSDFARRLLKREYELSCNCDHPHIARTFLYGNFLPGRTGILMEYVDGRTLAEYLAENPSAEAKRRIFQQLLDAVAYIHDKKLVHNDLKPENILISRNSNSLKLIDFGLADDDAHFLLKTPGCSDIYAAPELKENRSSTPGSDVYSLGKIMLTLFGKRHGHIRKKCLRINPERRYKDANELSQAWRVRRRPFFIAILIFICCLISLSLMAVSDSYHESVRRQAEEMNNLRINYTELNDSQSQLRSRYEDIQGAYEGVKGGYNDVKGDYENMKGDYMNMKGQYNDMQENMEAQRTLSEKREQARNAEIDNFRVGLQEIVGKARDDINNCKSIDELNKIQTQYLLQLKNKCESCPTKVNGEDITSELLSVYSSQYNKLNQVIESKRNIFLQDFIK